MSLLSIRPSRLLAGGTLLTTAITLALITGVLRTHGFIGSVQITARGVEINDIAVETVWFLVGVTILAVCGVLGFVLKWILRGYPPNQTNRVLLLYFGAWLAVAAIGIVLYAAHRT